MRPNRWSLWLTGLLALACAVASVVVWTRDAASQPAPPSQATQTQADLVAQGETLFLAKGCAGCHRLGGLAESMSIGPDLTLLAQNAGTRVAGMTAEDYVRVSILNPSAYIVPGYSGQYVAMPALPVSAAEVEALVALLLYQRE
ncbi:MAG: hypothetical protein DCC58_10010 [Chloroflexi bacterium]|nr:MAG: hypothetical protein DCC58_10010 [Chloroflexota bacterium]